MGLDGGIPGHHQPTGEDLKAELVPLDPMRSADAMRGVDLHPLQHLTERATFGPYTTAQLYAEHVTTYLSDPSQIRIIGCGRNEHGDGKGSLTHVLRYAHASTRNAGNVHFHDGDSTDGSLEAARALGVESYARNDMLRHVNLVSLANVLAVPVQSMQGQHIDGFPPLRKGIDTFAARIRLLQDRLEHRAPKHVLWIDTDLHSIPGGKVAGALGADRIYHPIQMLGAAFLEHQTKHPGAPLDALITASGNRNNQPIHALGNSMHARAASFAAMGDRARHAIAETFATFLGQHGHPLSGELLTSTDLELNSPGATGQATEMARLLMLATRQYRRHGIDHAALQHAVPFAGDVRRGNQERMDRPQTDEKEWWMITGVLPQFTTVVMEYALNTGRHIDEWTLADYQRVNTILAQITYSARYDDDAQTRRYHHGPMERLIPPVSLLHKEGVIQFV